MPLHAIWLSPLTIPQVCTHTHTHSMSDLVENLFHLRLGVQLIMTPKIISSNNSFWASKFVELRELPGGYLSDEFDSIKTFYVHY